MTDAAPYTPPPPCSMTDVLRWRAVIEAGRTLAARPKARVPGLRAIVKEAFKRSTLPAGHNSTASIFMRLLRQLEAWPSLDAAGRVARAPDLRGLCEAAAHELGDEHDPAFAGRLLNLTRPRADLDN